MMALLQTPEDAAARIAYLCSDVVVAVHPLAGARSSSLQLKQLADSGTLNIVAKSSPEVHYIRHNNDPLLSVLGPARAGKLVSVTAPASILVPSISHLYKLAELPVVIHVSLDAAPLPDYFPITSIRNAGWTIIQSESRQDGQDMALSAHALAIRSGKGVMHFFPAQSVPAIAEPVVPLDRDFVREILDSDTARFPLADAPTPGANAGDGQGGGAVPGRPDPSAGQDADALPSSSASVASQHLSAASVQSPPSDTTTVETSAPPVTSEDILQHASTVWGQVQARSGRQYRAFEYTGSPHAQSCLFIFGSSAAAFRDAISHGDGPTASVGVITARLYRPWIGSRLLDTIPRSVKKIAVLEQVPKKTMKWGPVLTDLLTSVKSGFGGVETIVGYRLGHVEPDTAAEALREVLQNLNSATPLQNLEVGKTAVELRDSKEAKSSVLPQSEAPYYKVLAQLFGDRVFIANAATSDHAGIPSAISASPEFGFGSLLARKERRSRFIAEVERAASGGSFATDEPRGLLEKWSLTPSDTAKTAALADDVIGCLEKDGSSLASHLLSSRNMFRKESLWLIGSDAWAYDLGNSGVHHVLASGEDVNMLIIDSTPYSDQAARDAERRKKDIGLYAMNFGNAYVASVAVYSSYTQVLQALLEADAFVGPSVVLAYLPYSAEQDSPLAALQETKKAVDLGYWPLYRWNPDNENKRDTNFSLDSSRIKQELKDFLARDNRLTQLMNSQPAFGASLSEDAGSELRARQRREARDAYRALLDGLAGAPLTILFASDNGNGVALAKKLAARGRARGLKTTVMAMEDYPLDDLATEENIILVTSTAGQGEFPQNGRSFWNAIKDNGQLDLASVQFSVFGLGDSHYWPRKEDRLYYNKPAKDLDRVLARLGAQRLAEVGLGDDQDPDGYETGYQDWEPKIWRALGVDGVEGVVADEPAAVTNEDIKLASRYLRGTIAEGLADSTTGAISADDSQLTKFHGTYMQDDRDIREERKAQGLEPAYGFMIRCRLPAGVATPDQWLQMDKISTDLGNETMKLTTRQTFQFHGVIKSRLKPAMRAINRALMTTLAACGDVNRNVMCSTLPSQSECHREVYGCASKISNHLLPSTTAYHEIWLTDDKNEKVQVGGDAIQDFEPLYGPTYLPRKFKISIAVPPHNDVDVYAHDVGLIAIKGADRHLAGFNVLAGGGMGATHNNKKTYPQVGRMLGFVAAEQVHIVCEKIMLVQRDHGDRKNRKHARLKYTIDDMGLEVFRAKVEDLWGHTFEPEKPFEFESNVDTFGWQRDEAGMNHFTLFIENGRVEDTSGFEMRTGLREIARVHRGEFRLTPNQHLILSNVADDELELIKALLKKYKLDNVQFSGLRLSSSACVAFPTCGLAMAESERYLPVLITKLEDCLEENGLGSDSIVMRMTGCPNGCARPWLAEVAFVGKAYGAYNMYLGGGYHGQRLNKLYRSSIKEDEILVLMKALLKRYAIEREPGERFGDFCIRAGIINPTREGKDFHDGVGEEDAED